MKDNIKKGKNKIVDQNLSRKEWIVKAGKYSVFTAASMMMILAPGKAQAADSPNANPADVPADDTVWN
jgi:hypothetical protein